MSALPSEIGKPSVASIKANQMLLAGKIIGRTKFNKLWVSIVRLPAADEFDFPQTVKVLSKQPIGEEGSTVRQLVRAAGRGYQGSITNEDTGEVRKFPNANMHFEAVED